jgi:hypothetical protein
MPFVSQQSPFRRLKKRLAGFPQTSPQPFGRPAENCTTAPKAWRAGGDLEMQGFNDCFQGAPQQLQVERRVLLRRYIQQPQSNFEPKQGLFHNINFLMYFCSVLGI